MARASWALGLHSPADDLAGDLAADDACFRALREALPHAKGGAEAGADPAAKGAATGAAARKFAIPSGPLELLDAMTWRDLDGTRRLSSPARVGLLAEVQTICLQPPRAAHWAFSTEH